MSELVRMSISLEQPLARMLDELSSEARCANRSEFIRDLIRNRVVEQEWAADAMALGTITLIYDHHQRQLNEKLIHLQHENPHAILASTHVHLNHQVCAEMIMMQDTAGSIQRMADLLGQQRGILHCSLSMSSTGKQLVREHGAAHLHSHGHSHSDGEVHSHGSHTHSQRARRADSGAKTGAGNAPKTAPARSAKVKTARTKLTVRRAR